MTGVLLSFHLFTLFRKGISMETNRTTSRRTLALIQIWASEADASSFARCKVSLSRLTPASRRCGLPQLRERRAFWQVGTSVSETGIDVKRLSACGRGLFIPRFKQGAFKPDFCKRPTWVPAA